jgi:hypothetical protein
MNGSLEWTHPPSTGARSRLLIVAFTVLGRARVEHTESRNEHGRYKK